jgi:tripartite-type tricarboxylate transporter receptor subunit TctC
MSEKGWKVVVPKFRGLVVKKGTPQPVVDYLIANSLKAIQSPEFQKYQKESFVEPAFLTGKDFLQLIEAQVAETEPVLRELGF